MPEWHHFVKDDVDSEDLSLNNSHWMLQQNKILPIIKKNMINRCMKMFKNRSEIEHSIVAIMYHVNKDDNGPKSYLTNAFLSNDESDVFEIKYFGDDQSGDNNAVCTT
eukprot:2947461-Ditylum_brightwellii.AAC.1